MAYMGGELDREIMARVGVPSVLRDLRAPGTPDYIGGPDGTSRPPPGFIERDGLWVPGELLRASEQVIYGSRQHPRGIGYDLGAVTRMRMTALEHPEWVAAGLTGLAVWGLTYFCDDADTCVLSGGRPHLATHAGAVTRRRSQGVQSDVSVYKPDPYCPDLLTVPPVLALTGALRSLAKGEHSWYVLPGTGLSDDDLRAVQLIDAVSAIFGTAPDRWPQACFHQTSRSRLNRLVAFCDQGAESPMETVLRLLAGQILPGLVSQLVIYQDGSVADPVHSGADPAHVGEYRTGRIVARLDLGHPALKLALQYDGAGHLTAARRDRDSKVNAELANLGWHVLRITYGHLRDPDMLAATIRDGVDYCQRRTVR